MNEHSICTRKIKRRARAEAQSKLKALKAREAKGLLSAKEKAELAAAEEANARAGADKGDCQIM